MMKKIMLALCAVLVSVITYAQNDKADNILGKYFSTQGKDSYRVQITKQSDGTYKGTIYWLSDPYEKDGSISLDKKNPDKSLRNTPMDKVVLFSGLSYNKEKKQWDGAKIYDPQRGISVKMTARFEDAGTLIIRGTVLGIGESISWKKE
jgi:uncharacterized protein (DUF2147 family)